MSKQEVTLPPRLASLVPVIIENSKETQEKNLFETLVQRLPELMAVERCSIFLLDPINNRVLLQFGTGMLERELNLPLSGTLAGDVIQSGVPRIVEDLSPYQTVQEEVKEMTGFQTNNILCVPIHHPKGQCCAGAIQLLNKSPARRFDMHDLSEVATLTQYLRAPLAELIRQHMKFLQELERKKKKDKPGLVASFLSKWSPVHLGGK